MGEATAAEAYALYLAHAAPTVRDLIAAFSSASMHEMTQGARVRGPL